MTNITFSTCWYILKSKFDVETYTRWMDNMLSNVNSYNLVVYSDKNSASYIEKYLDNPRIKLVIKEVHEFYNYKYKKQWIKNHLNNELLRDKVNWQVNMLWNEKVCFVNETVQEKYFDTEFYGWCDIGYFRNRKNDTCSNELTFWPSPEKIESLDKNRIYYACVNNNKPHIEYLYYLIQNKNDLGLPKYPIPPEQFSIAGGFFILHKDKMEWWKTTYDTRLQLYFDNDYLVKDDQIIVVDCVFTEIENFKLCCEANPEYDNWFLFQRYLSV